MERHAGLKVRRQPRPWRTPSLVLAAALGGILSFPQAAWSVESGARLVHYRVVGDGIPAALTGDAGDPRRGRVAAANSSQGNCLICHRMPISDVPVFGDVGPPLDGVGSRLTEAQLRLRLVNARKLNPDSIMPAYYKVEGLHRVAAKYRYQPLLGAQEIEDIVAYLRTLK